MKKVLLELLKKHYKFIAENWVRKLSNHLGHKLSESQISTLVKSTLDTVIELVESSDFESLDRHLVENFYLFSGNKLNLLEISQLYSQGRFAILNVIENDKELELDPVIILGYIDDIFEQLYARYSMLHQEALMSEVKLDRDRLADQLDESSQYLSSIMHSSDSAIIVIDKDEKIISWNKGAEKIFGYTEKEILFKPSDFLVPDDSKYKSELNEIIAEVSKEGFIQIEETERVTKSIGKIPVQLNVTKLPGGNGNYAGRSVIIKDLSEVKRLRRQVDQSEKLAVIGQLAAGIAHEIGNPLASISMIVQILQRRNKDEFTREQLAGVKENIDRISKIVRELVDFSRPPSYQKQFVQLTDVIRTALGIVKYDKRVKKVKFETDLEGNLPTIEIVPDQMLQVFVNILINALDAIEGNGTIRVKSYYDDDFIYVDITDDGMGMDEQTIAKVFDPFFTTKEVGKGTGLGLSVSYGIVKKAHGDIEINSRINEGSTFTVKLPLNR